MNVFRFVLGLDSALVLASGCGAPTAVPAPPAPVATIAQPTAVSVQPRAAAPTDTTAPQTNTTVPPTNTSLPPTISPASTPSATATNTVVPPTATTAATATATATTMVEQKFPIPLTHLPIGPSGGVSKPTRGNIYRCPYPLSDIGARARGDWILDGYYNLTTKPHVQGAVSWPDANFQIVLSDKRVITTNDLPMHDTGEFPITKQTSPDAFQYGTNPNKIEPQDYVFELPRDPEVAKNPTCLGASVIGVLLTGGVFFSAFDARGEDGVAYEMQDECAGHPAERGIYHYHSLTPCIPSFTPGEHSPLVGYALDGFGLYGHQGEHGLTLTNDDLDECHGHVHKITWDGKLVKMYHYHATWEFPYTVGCYRGTPVKLP